MTDLVREQLARAQEDLARERELVAKERRQEMLARKAEFSALSGQFAADQRQLEQIVAQTDPTVVNEREQQRRAVALANERVRRTIDAAPSTSLFARFTPRRNRWNDIRDFDERVEQLERRRAEMAAEIQRLEADRQAAEQEHQAALEQWFLDGENGPRPQSRVPEIDAQLLERRADQDASAPAVDRLLEEKARYVQQHRKRLQNEAANEREKAAASYRSLIAQSAQARDDLIAARELEVWCACFPSELAQAKPGHPHAICIGLQKPVADRLDGLKAMVQADRLFDLLQADADTVASMATPEQAQALGGTLIRRPTDQAMWTEDPAYQEWAKQETQRLRELAEFAAPAQLAQLADEKRAL